MPSQDKHQLYRKRCSAFLDSTQPIVSEDQTAALMSRLFEMGFCDRQLNLRLLKKHDCNILQVVTELLRISDDDWYSHRY